MAEEASAPESLEVGRLENPGVVVRKAGSKVAEEAECETKGEA